MPTTFYTMLPKKKDQLAARYFVCLLLNVLLQLSCGVAVLLGGLTY